MDVHTILPSHEHIVRPGVRSGTQVGRHRVDKGGQGRMLRANEMIKATAIDLQPIRARRHDHRKGQQGVGGVVHGYCSCNEG